jgi:cytochrome P450
MSNIPALSPAVPKPEHVADHLVYDFDMYFDPGLWKDPHVRVRDLMRKAPPIFWTPRNGGHWMFLTHAINFKAARDTETFTSEFVTREKLAAIHRAMPAGSPHIPMAVPINLDPPQHTRYRAPLQAAFSPKAIMALKEDIRTLCNELIDKFVDRGHCELMSEIAEPLPVQVFLKMLGLPVSRQEEYRGLVREHLGTARPDPLQGMMRLQKIAASMRDTILDRREHPQNDIISSLWQQKVNGESLNLEDMENYGVLLFLAGLDTVMNGMGFGVRHLALDIDLQERLRANPELVGEATEEILRRYSFTVPPRKVRDDTIFEGVAMKAGETVFLYLPAADLDPDEYPNPESVNLNRENKVHIAFNAGPHRCLGSHLARVELQVLYEQLLKRLPTFHLDPNHTPRFHGGGVLGVDSLHLQWNNAAGHHS